MQAKSKPKVITFNRTWDGPRGQIHYFNIEFEDGMSGEFGTTKKEQDKFVIGQEATYSYEKKTKNNDGSEYYKIDLVREQQSSGRGGYGGKEDPTVTRSILANVCLRSAMLAAENLGLGDKVDKDLKAIFALADLFYKHIMGQAAEDRQKRISLQARLEDACKYLVRFKGLEITSSQQVLELVDLTYKYVESKMQLQ